MTCERDSDRSIRREKEGANWSLRTISAASRDNFKRSRRCFDGRSFISESEQWTLVASDNRRLLFERRSKFTPIHVFVHLPVVAIAIVIIVDSAIRRTVMSARLCMHARSEKSDKQLNPLTLVEISSHASHTRTPLDGLTSKLSSRGENKSAQMKALNSEATN